MDNIKKALFLMLGLMGTISCSYANGNMIKLNSEQGSIKEVSTLFRTITVDKHQLMLSDPLVIKDSSGQLVNHKYLKPGMTIKYAFIKNNESLNDIETKDGKPYASEGNITHIIIESKVPKENLLH